MQPTGAQIEPFDVMTNDDITIRGLALAKQQAMSTTAVVVCHGFCGSSANPRNVLLAHVLAERFGVFLFDFRGHGRSDGVSTLGDREALDVDAVVSFARSRGFERVVTIGPSMGGISVLRAAARFKNVDGVVTISAPARWTGHGARARFSGLLVSTRAGRTIAKRALRTRVAPTWTWTAPPIELIASIDVPILILHGRNDRFIRPVDAELLRAHAHADARLFLLDRFGHAEAAYSEGFAYWLSDRIGEMHVA
jgi:pimeloyl-ACP methyl ester carboxylesterase